MKKYIIFAVQLMLGSLFLFLGPMQLQAAQQDYDAKIQVAQHSGICLFCQNEVSEDLLPLACKQGSVCRPCARFYFAQNDACPPCRTITPQAVCIDTTLVHESEHKAQHDVENTRTEELLAINTCINAGELQNDSNRDYLKEQIKPFWHPLVNIYDAIARCQVHRYLGLKKLHRQKYKKYINFQETDNKIMQRVQTFNRSINSLGRSNEDKQQCLNLITSKQIGTAKGELDENIIQALIESSNTEWEAEEKRAQERTEIAAPHVVVQQLPPSSINIASPAVDPQPGNGNQPRQQRSFFSRMGTSLHSTFWSSPRKQSRTVIATLVALGALIFGLQRYTTMQTK